MLEMATRTIVVKVARDAQAGVWFIESSDLPGLHIEAESLEAFTEKLPGALQDLLEEADEDGGFEVPVELIAHASMQVRISAR